MKAIGYGIGVALLFLAAATLVAQLFSLIAYRGYHPVALGSIWHQIGADSLTGFQSLIEKDVTPALWPPIQWVLGLPAWLVLGVVGGVLYFGCRRRGRGFD